MKNVIIFAVEGARFAIELRWVREVITMGHMTFVPGAPLHLVGAINVHGAITPVLDLTVLSARADAAKSDVENDGPHFDTAESHGGDSALLLDVDGTTMALRMLKVDAVVTAEICAESPGKECAGVVTSAVRDAAGRCVGLVDPHALMQLTLVESQALASRHPAGYSARTIHESGGRE